MGIDENQADPLAMPEALTGDTAAKGSAKRHAYPLSRGWVKHKLIHEVARKEKSTTQLAEEYGVTTSAISQFKTRHATRIAEVEQDIENAFAGLWIAQKEARLAEYQEDVDRIGDADDPALLRIKAAMLKAVAEEMGHLPTKTSMQVEKNKVTYTIEGVDLDELR